MVAYREIGKLKQPNAFGGWLLRIARHEAIRVCKSRRVTVPLDEREHGAPMVDKPCQFGDQSELLREVDRLPGQERIVVSLRYFSGLSVEDIAVQLSRPIGTVTKQLTRARIRLRQALERNGHE